MSDERKPLKMTDDQKDALTEVLRVATGIEWEEQCTAMDGVLVLWPLIRDYVLEEAAKACVPAVMEPKGYGPGEYVCDDDKREALGAEVAAMAIRAMKGSKLGEEPAE